MLGADSWASPSTSVLSREQHLLLTPALLSITEAQTCLAAPRKCLSYKTFFFFFFKKSESSSLHNFQHISSALRHQGSIRLKSLKEGRDLYILVETWKYFKQIKKSVCVDSRRKSGKSWAQGCPAWARGWLHTAPVLGQLSLPPAAAHCFTSCSKDYFLLNSLQTLFK